MYIMYYIYLFIICFLFIMTRICYVICFTQSTKIRKPMCKNPAKTMIILGSGGHTAEMLRILVHLNLKNYAPRIYVHASTDTISAEKVEAIEKSNTDYKIIKIHRSREVQQSYHTSMYSTLRAILDSIPLLWKEHPDLILCNGPGTCVPLCLVAFFFKLFCIQKPTIIFIESFCRVKTFSLTAKILYYLTDHVIVQWPYLTKSMYSRAVFIMCEETSIARLIPWELLQTDLENFIPIEIKVHLGPMVVMLDKLNKNELNVSSQWIESTLILVEACLDKTWEMLNSGYWKDVPLSYRYCYSICAVIKATLLELQCNSHTIESVNTRTIVLKNIEQIDKGLLLGAPLPSIPDLLTKIASKLNTSYTKSLRTSNSEEFIISCEASCDTLLPGFLQLISYDEPSMETFYREMFMPKKPAILKGCMKHWQALQKWKDLRYLNEIAGSRTVPIEIGSRYTEEDWTQHLINFSEFIKKHISAKSDKIGYLAQHPLFEQIPELKNDFAVPEYCNFTESEEMEEVDINAWFGPGGTVSPLHFDPKNNLLCQVFGHKRVLLYHPEETVNLYSYDTRLLNNTAQVDPMKPDYEKWPNFIKAKGVMCYLKPGQMLYIPPKWWHHVTALTPSFSVSFWWN